MLYSAYDSFAAMRVVSVRLSMQGRAQTHGSTSAIVRTNGGSV
jgi:hypothetical protein